MLSQTKNGYDSDLEPTEFYLSPNYPNPFREKTKIKYCVAQTTRVKLTVYDLEGREIIKLVDEEKNPGTYEVEFSACPALVEQSFRPCLSGRQVVRNLEAGIYFYRLEAGDYKNEMKMELLK
jgi:hypothetical protein